MRLWSRFGNDLTWRFPAIAEAPGGLDIERALIDGEAVVLRSDGYCDFEALLPTQASSDDLAIRSVAVAAKEIAAPC